MLTLFHHFRTLLHMVKDLLTPRAIAWRYMIKKYPNKSILTRLGRKLKVRIYPHDIIGKDIFVKGMFEAAEVNFVTKFLKPGMIVFDVGANLGQYTLFSADCVGVKGKVHSFEPTRRMFKELQYNVSLNNLQDICYLNNVAISEKEGKALLSVYETGAEVFNSIGGHKRSEAKIVGHEEVETISLDDYCKKNNIDNVDFIKIDIEGAELSALKGAKMLLSKAQAPTILLEMADINTIGFGYYAVDIWDFLTQFGYTMYSLDMKPVLKPSNFLKANNLVAKKC